MSDIATNKKITIQQMTKTAIITALFCVLAPFSIPIPISPVPLSLTNFVIFISVFVLPVKFATLSYVLYLLLGIAGLPVFSGFSGGVAKLVGPTGGYLIGMVFVVLIGGLFLQRAPKERWYIFYLVGMIIGEAIMYVPGTAWLAHSLNVSFNEALFMGVIPYLPGDFVKLLLAMKIGHEIRKALTKATGSDPIG